MWSKFLAIVGVVCMLCLVGCGADKSGDISPPKQVAPPQEQVEPKDDAPAKTVTVSKGRYSNDDTADKAAAHSDRATAKEQTAVENNAAAHYTLEDIAVLNNTGNFAHGALAHIFDGTINKKGKATGYHYSMVADSKGKIVAGTRKNPDSRGVFTAKVEVDGVRKDGFSSFYPETWSPQQVVDAINAAYADALADPSNPHGSLWMGHVGDLEINMYLTDDKKIITAFPIYAGNKK